MRADNGLDLVMFSFCQGNIVGSILRLTDSSFCMVPTAKQRSFQYQIWLMLIIVFGVILAGFLMVPNTEEERQAMMERMGTTNQGDIVSRTVDMTALLGSLPQGEAPKWKVVVAGGQGCDHRVNLEKAP